MTGFLTLIIKTFSFLLLSYHYLWDCTRRETEQVSFSPVLCSHHITVSPLTWPGVLPGVWSLDHRCLCCVQCPGSWSLTSRLVNCSSVTGPGACPDSWHTPYGHMAAIIICTRLSTPEPWAWAWAEGKFHSNWICLGTPRTLMMSPRKYNSWGRDILVN